MNSSGVPKSYQQPFTLAQLIVAAVVLAIFMVLFFPRSHPGESAPRAQAGHDVQNIVAAIKSYQIEYGFYPDVGAAAGQDALIGDPTFAPGHPNSDVFNILRAIPEGRNANDAQNPRKVPFFEGKVASSATTPKAGFAQKGSGRVMEGSYYDPWGQQYGIVIDSNRDNRIDVSRIYQDFPHPADSPRVGVGAFSIGKDHQPGAAGDRKFKDETGKKSDDVVSWW